MIVEEIVEKPQSTKKGKGQKSNDSDEDEYTVEKVVEKRIKRGKVRLFLDGERITKIYNGMDCAKIEVFYEQRGGRGNTEDR